MSENEITLEIEKGFLISIGRLKIIIAFENGRKQNRISD